MRRSLRPVLNLALLAALTTLGTAGATPAPSPWEAKVAPRVWADLDKGDAAFLVVLAEQADLSGAAALPTKEEKGAFVVKALRETAARAQKSVVRALEASGAEVRPYWVANFVLAKGGYAALEAAASRPEVREILSDGPVIAPPEPEERSPGPAPAAVELGVTRIRAPEVWGLGFTGQGVTVAGQDTGYQWDHPALRPQYRGWSGAAADHNYNWHDAIHANNPNTGTGNPCGFNLTAPCDDHGHGTHTMGTMAGTDGGANQIGVAPGARWIGCRNMEEGWGNPSTYAECFQWFLAPTDLSGGNADASKAPDVINNSWGCPPEEGCTDVGVFSAVVTNLKAAGIVVVASAGNTGSTCSTIVDPPSIYADAFTVGATGTSAPPLEGMASFSSRGPVTVDGSNRRKPDVSAPGSSVRSSIPPSSYGYKSGTSMAGPHVAGAVALLLSARPDWRGQVDTVETLLERTAVPLATSGQTCGGIADTVYPNNTSGWGRIDVYAALSSDTDGDAVANLSDCLPLDNTVWAAPSEARTLLLTGKPSTALSWTAPATPGGTGVLYDVLRSTSPSDFTAATTCLESGATGLSASDATAPSPVFYYLVRAKNSCGGTLGTTSSGSPRTGRACT